MRFDENQNAISDCDKQQQKSAIQNYYVNKTLFITGATGYCGKVLLARILGSLDDLKLIYVLIRPQKGLSGKKRFEKLITSRPFTFVNICSKNLAKICVVEGDVTQKNLGMDIETYEKIINETNIVLNAAASVKFVATVKYNIDNNCESAINLIDAAKSMINLDCFVHISTAYSNCNLPEIDEKVYPLDCDARQLLDRLRNLDENQVEKVAEKYYNGRPNSYIFSKALTENLITEISKSGKRLAIIRPSIVSPSFFDPVPGWVDSINGPASFVLLWSSGLICCTDWSFLCNPDFVPVDYLANCSLSVPCYMSMNNQQFKIYNLCRNVFQPQSKWDIYSEVRLGFHAFLKAPASLVLRPSYYPPQLNHRSNLQFKVEKFFFNFLYALLVDTIIFICGKQPFLLRLLQRSNAGMDAMKYFSQHEWKFKSDNCLQLLANMTDLDKKMFNFHYFYPDREEIADFFWLGARRFILKQPDSNIEAAKTRYYMVIFAYRVLVGLIYFTLGMLLMNLIGFVIPYFKLIIAVYIIITIARDVWLFAPLLAKQIKLGKKLVEYDIDTSAIGNECK